MRVKRKSGRALFSLSLGLNLKANCFTEESYIETAWIFRQSSALHTALPTRNKWVLAGILRRRGCARQRASCLRSARDISAAVSFMCCTILHDPKVTHARFCHGGSLKQVLDHLTHDDTIKQPTVLVIIIACILHFSNYCFTFSWFMNLLCQKRGWWRRLHVHVIRAAASCFCGKWDTPFRPQERCV